MSATGSAIADLLQNTCMMMKRFLDGFDDSNATTQAPNHPNHLMWQLGHVTSIMHAVTDTITGEKRPTPLKYDDYGFQSKPVADAAAYPTLAEMVSFYDTTVNTLVETVRGFSDDDLARMVPFFGDQELPVAQAAGFMVFHNGTHAGEIIDLRRALGMPGVIG